MQKFHDKLLAGTIAMCLAVAGQPAAATGQPSVEVGEDKPGGAATSRGSTDVRNAFSHPSGNIGFAKEFDFKIGNALFRKLWVSAPSSTRSSDGLGPLYNARSCQRCHLKDGRGHPPAANWPADNAVSMLLRLSIPPQSDEQRRLLSEGRVNVIAEPTYGTQLQDLAIQGHAGEGRLHITYTHRQVKLAGGEIVNLRAPAYRITELAYGPLHARVMISPRVAPQMIGLGLLEAIPPRDVLSMADPDDRDGDGISGRPNRVWSRQDNKMVLGRFGWKAGAATVLEQSAAAFVGDIGISNHVLRRPSGDCTSAQSRCLAAANGESNNEPEIKPALLDLVAFYARNLAVPRRRNHKEPQVLRGKKLFKAIGCATCHRPSFTTGQRVADAHLRHQKIWPYTDLLLHDMGAGLADNRPEGRANGREWRTAPLWGIGLTKVVSGHTFFLHDGRARSIKEAIMWHGGEAETAKQNFAALPKRDRERLIAFVNSL